MLPLLPLLATLAATSAPSLCQRLPDGVVVDVDAKVLLLCRGGAPDATYPVNLGQGGVGKKRQGDKKTPLGRYALARPRASNSGFTWFVPVGYPTTAQRKLGYTGGSIGIHGPPDWMPQVVIDVAFDSPWTDGCIMLRTTAEIAAVRRWMLKHRPDTIEILSAARLRAGG